MKKYLILLIFLSMGISTLSEEQNIESIFMEEIEKEDKRPKQTLNIVQSLKIQTIDPVKIKDQYSERATNFIYDTLFIKDKDEKLIPNLVEEYYWKNDLTLWIKLKENIKFHDKSLLKSKDVKFSLERVAEEGSLRDTYEEIKNIKIIDDSILEIVIDEPNNTFLEKLSYTEGAILKRNGKYLIGTGGYYPTYFSGGVLHLKRNVNYFKGKPYIKEIKIFNEISDRKKIVSIFNEGNDVAYDVVSKNYLESKKENIISDDIEVKKNDLVETTIMLFGNKNKDFYDREIKKVIEKGIDRKKMAYKILGDSENYPKTFMPEELFKVKLSFLDNKFEMKNEEKISRTLNLMVANNMLDQGEFIKESLKSCGIEVNILPHDLTSYNMKIENGDYDIALYDMTYKKDYILYSIRDILLNKIKDVEVYSAISPFLRMANIEENPEKREEVYDRIVQLMYKEMVYIPLLHKNLFIVGSDRLERVNEIDDK